MAAAACSGGGSGAPPPASPPPGAPPPAGPYAQPYPQAPAGPGVGAPQVAPAQPPPAPAPPSPQAARPLLAPLVGYAAMQDEVRRVLAELVAALPATQRAKVQGIPLVFDPTVEVNAFAGCDDAGAPFLAATRGMLDAVDALAQTRATDELFGTSTYETYARTVTPALVQDPNASAALPPGLVPAQLGPDPRRWSRARELYGEIVAFTFGHELAHHYLDHTGCAHGQGGAGPALARLGHLATRVAPGLNQPNELAADAAGAYDALDAGRARAPQYVWTERGGIALLDFFARLERAAGVSPLSPVGFLRTHPNPAFRIPILQQTAATWRLQRGVR